MDLGCEIEFEFIVGSQMFLTNALSLLVHSKPAGMAKYAGPGRLRLLSTARLWSAKPRNGLGFSVRRFGVPVIQPLCAGQAWYRIHAVHPSARPFYRGDKKEQAAGPSKSHCKSLILRVPMLGPSLME